MAAHVVTLGGWGGEDFESNHKGKITGLRVSAGSAVDGIQVLANGRPSAKFGGEGGSQKTIYWGEQPLIEVQIWTGLYEELYIVRGMLFRWGPGETAEVGEQEGDFHCFSCQQLTQVAGRAGSFIDSLTFHFS